MNTRAARILPSLAIALLCAALAGSAFAEGAGGPFFSLAQPGWNPDFMPAVPASQPEFECMGGGGYGVTRDGVIIGGFGLAFLDYDIYDQANWGATSQVPRHVAGGAGGLIVGSRVFGSRSGHLDLAARLGLGGMGLATRSGSGAGDASYDTEGFAIVYAEPYVELGLGLTPWMQLCAILSYPVIGNLIPGKPFDEVSYHTPALGLTLSFGSF